MPSELELGLTGEVSQEVTEQDTAARWGSGLVDAYATPALVALAERASVSAIKNCLSGDQTSVGVEVNIKHLAATPIGMTVRARAELIGTDGKRLKFKIEAWDAREKVGEGTHVRAVIDRLRFLQRLSSKSQEH